MTSRLLSMYVLILGCLTCASLCGADPVSAKESKKLTSEEAGKLRGKIRAALFVPDPLPALEPATHGKFEPEPGVVAERVTYASQFGLRVPAILYLPKERKGGTPALGVDVPALTRKQLSVFSPEEWEKNKHRLIYESWVKEARSRLEGAH